MDPPLPAAIMRGTAALTVMNVPVSVTSISSRNSARSIAQVSFGQEMIAALAATMSSRPPSSATPSSSTASTPAQVPDVGLPRDDPPVERLDLLDGLREVGLGGQRVAQPARGGARVERDDVAALLRQPHARATGPGRAPPR